VGLAAIQGYRLIARRYLPVSHILFLSVASTLIAEWVLLGSRDGRYLLPLIAPLVLLAGVELSDLIDRRGFSRRAAAALVALALALNARAMWDFRYYNYLWTNPPGSLPESTRLHRLIGYLEANGAHYVFSMNGLLDSQLTFYSDEK